MLIYTEKEDILLNHEMQPSGPIPTICDPDGIYPYESFVETAERPRFVKVKMIIIENDSLRVKICPSLGGKIFSIFDKTVEKEILYDSGSVKPVRILPRMAFISGGIEVSFPISHTPTQIEAVQYKVEKIDNRIYFWCGEREIRSGMNWTVEFSLGEGEHYLTQRTLFVNPTKKTHSWMSWSNAALPVREDSELHFPSGDVLYHGQVMKEFYWDNEKKNYIKDFDGMAGFFWKNVSENAFGVFTPSLGTGLYHIADESDVPGIKLWTYGIGKDEVWSYNTSMKKESYVEIQAGPIKDQSIKDDLTPGQEKFYSEFWIPTSVELRLNELKMPSPKLISRSEIPIFEWTKRDKVLPWLELLAAYEAKDVARIPKSPDLFQSCWPPSGMHLLEESIQWAIENTHDTEKDLWTSYLGLWCAGSDLFDKAIRILSEAKNDFARLVEARIHLRNNNNPIESLKSLGKIATESLKLHPQVIIERDMALELIGSEKNEEREFWLNQVNALNDEGIVERRCQLLFDSGDYQGANELLERTKFTLVHQRYFRTNLWTKVNEKFGNEVEKEFLESLGEDSLAKFGQYRVYDPE